METSGIFGDLPVTGIIPEIRAALRLNRGCVLCAPPGSGKTTVVPLALMDEPWLNGRRILLLEPRRMAARAASWRMSDLLGEPPGARVGYHIRLERNFGKDSRIVVLTEGLLARRFLADPEISDAGMIIFDEFHERSIHADYGLALALDVQRNLRPDLRILIMSATLDATPAARHLGLGTPVMEAQGRMFPVDTVFSPRPGEETTARQTARVVLRALAETDGSVLAFLPGEGEIRAAADQLAEAVGSDPAVRVYPLYSALPKGEQDAALRPAPCGCRKVVLATSIAESSLTIEGITAVVDSGRVRVSRFSPSTGMSRLETLRITRDRADQRKGRAGRLGPGVCYRIWDEDGDARLAPAALPEILTADLAPVVLQTADWGVSNPGDLPWLTPPPAGAWSQAVELLKNLDALDGDARITSHGRRMARLGAHPRLAHAMLAAAEQGCAEDAGTAGLIAAILSEYNGNSGAGFRSSNIEHILDQAESGSASGSGMTGAERKKITSLADAWIRELRKNALPENNCPERGARLSPGLILAWAYPDRIGLRRRTADDAERYMLSGGRGVKLRKNDPLAQHDWIVAADIDDNDADASVRLAAPIRRREAELFFSRRFRKEDHFEWDPRLKKVDAAEREMFGSIIVRERPLKQLDPEDVLRCLCSGIRAEGLASLGWTKASENLRARIRLVYETAPEENMPDVSDECLLRTLESWLGNSLYGMISLAQASSADLCGPLQALLGSSARRLDVLAPAHLAVPSGSGIRIDYTNGRPEASVRIQEVFGMTKTPLIVNGRIPILLKLLSPAQRPVQVTADLESFWKNGYAGVRKDLRGRYPKHYWPENPLEATPTRRVRPE